MSKFKNNDKKPAPAINTSSLPDIVFMLLFFFMVATTTKDIDPMVKLDSARGKGVTDLTPFKQRSEVDFVYMGKPLKGDASKFDKGIAVQFDGILPENGINYIVKWKDMKYANKPSGYTIAKEEVVTCFKADEQVPVGILFQARQLLQDNDYNSIAYGAAEKPNGKDYKIDAN